MAQEMSDDEYMPLIKEKKVKFQEVTVDSKMDNIIFSNALEQASVPTLLGSVVAKEATNRVQ